MRRFNYNQIKIDLRRSFLLSAILCLSVFAWLKIIFFDIAFSISNEGAGLIQTVLSCWLLIFAVKMLLGLFLFVAEKVQNATPLTWVGNQVNTLVDITARFSEEKMS